MRAAERKVLRLSRIRLGASVFIRAARTMMEMGGLEVDKAPSVWSCACDCTANRQDQKNTQLHKDGCQRGT